MTAPERIAPEAAAYYLEGLEQARLLDRAVPLEYARTHELLRQYLPPPPAVVLDAGGGPGVYACALAAEGYAVHLLDAMPLHVEQARAASARQPRRPLASAEIGDARAMTQADAVVDAVLLLGPLYHLIERRDRIQALTEARRVLRPGGVLFAAGISRFASPLDGFDEGAISDPAFQQIVEDDLRTGQHRNPTDNPAYFTTSFFHRPDELEAEVIEAGFSIETLVAVERPFWLLKETNSSWDDSERRERLLGYLRAVESEPSLLGVSAHIMVIAHPADGC